MPGDEHRDCGEHLAAQARALKSASAELHGRVLAVATMIMGTETDVARTLDRMAKDNPGRAARLKTMSEHARANAAHERHWIDDHTPE